MTNWYTENALYAYLKQEKPNLLAYAGWIAGHLQKAFDKGRQIGAAEPDLRNADELKRLGTAVTAMVAWFDAEKADTGTFWDKAELCKYAEWAARKAIGQDVGEFEGIPRLFLVHTNAAGEIPQAPEKHTPTGASGGAAGSGDSDRATS